MADFRDKVPHTFATIIIGQGSEAVSFINRMDNKMSDKNLHLTNLSVDQLNADTIKYSFSIQYHPNSFSKADTLKLERMVSTILTNQANDENTIIKVKFGYISGSPYSNKVKKESALYCGCILEMKTNIQQNYIEYSFTACGTHKIAENTILSNDLKLTIKDPITDWIKEKLIMSNNLSSGLVSGFAVSFQAASGKSNNLFKPKFDFKSDVEIPSILELTGVRQMLMKTGFDAITVDKMVNGIDLEDILDFSEYDPNVTLDAQCSLTFPANFSLMTLLNGLCDKINKLCKMEGITYTKYKHLYNHSFKVVFDSVIVDQGTLGTIYFTDITDDKNKDNFNYIFNYGFINKGDTLIDHTVLSWECDYNATAMIHNSVITDELNVKQAIDNMGTVMSISGGSSPLEGSVTTGIKVVDAVIIAAENIAKIKDSWAYPYEATLTVLGNPEPIQVCRKVIQVIPMINHNRHHTAGKYLIKGVSHNIDSSMTFTTTYQLIRLNSEKAKLFEEGQGNYSELVDLQNAAKSDNVTYKVAFDESMKGN